MNRIWLGAGLVALGCAGADGEDGTRGKAGESASASVRDATQAECSSGGSVLEIGVGDDLEETVICNGIDGTDGEPGEDGERGPRGDAGADASPSIGTIVLGMSCEGPLTDAPGLYANHQVTLFADGSAFVSGLITNGINQSSASGFYGPEQVGSQALGTTVVFDVQGPNAGGIWRISVNPETLESTFVYTDSDLVEGERTWTKSVEDCTVYRY